MNLKNIKDQVQQNLEKISNIDYETKLAHINHDTTNMQLYMPFAIDYNRENIHLPNGNKSYDINDNIDMVLSIWDTVPDEYASDFNDNITSILCSIDNIITSDLKRIFLISIETTASYIYYMMYGAGKDIKNKELFIKDILNTVGGWNTSSVFLNKYHSFTPGDFISKTLITEYSYIIKRLVNSLIMTGIIPSGPAGAFENNLMHTMFSAINIYISKIEYTYMRNDFRKIKREGIEISEF